MGKSKRLPANVKLDDVAAYAALQAVDNYRPNNAEFEMTRVADAYQMMIAKQTEEVQKQAAAEAAEDASEAAEHRFHEMVLGIKDQIRSQFGDNSDEYASLGLKKKDDYRSRRRGAAKKTANPI
ncbi:MAG: hypothetical protein JSS81_19825 [Acidobacteria bacterium]|nr:hypothetical protein [Acidobacteriota bacterium]